VSGTNIINATASALILRFSRLTAALGTVSNPSFTLASLPAQFGTVNNKAVQTYASATIFEGVSGGISGLSSGQTVSISALFLNPNTSTQAFHAAKVRVP